MKRICFFNGGMSRGGGTERITQIIANSLANTGKYHVGVLSLTNPTNTSYFKLSDNVYHSTLFEHTPKGKLGALKTILKLHRFLKKEKIAVLINVDVMLGFFSLPARLFTKTKIIAWEMFNYYNDIGTKKSFLARKLSLKYCDYYINLTSADVEVFKRNFKIRCPISFIYNPIDIDLSYKNYAIDSKIIMTAGHFFYTKGYDLAVDVAQRVLEKHKDWQWCFYGDGEEFEELKSIVSKRKLDNKIIFAGRKRDLEKYYRNSSIYVMTSRTEGFGLVLLEAQSNNLPIVSFDVPFGPKEIIEDNVNGFLVEAFDIDAMANKINKLIENENLRLSFSMNAKINMGKFDLKQITNKWCEIINSISERI